MTNTTAKETAEARRAVRRYLDRLDQQQERRRGGDRRPTQRLEEVKGKLDAALSNGVRGLQRVQLIQQRREVEEEIRGRKAARTPEAPDDADFVTHGRLYAAAKGITYGAFREFGVPAAVLRRAGIARKA